MAKRKKKAKPKVRTCCVCGCTEACGCLPDGCGWVPRTALVCYLGIKGLARHLDLCTACAELLAPIIRQERGITTEQISKYIGHDSTGWQCWRIGFRAGAHAGIRASRARLLKLGI